MPHQLPESERQPHLHVEAEASLLIDGLRRKRHRGKHARQWKRTEPPCPHRHFDHTLNSNLQLEFKRERPESLDDAPRRRCDREDTGEAPAREIPHPPFLLPARFRRYLNGDRHLIRCGRDAEGGGKAAASITGFAPGSICRACQQSPSFPPRWNWPHASTTSASPRPFRNDTSPHHIIRRSRFFFFDGRVTATHSVTGM